MTTDEEATNQKLALVEQSLDALYQTMDKIQGEKNHVSRNNYDMHVQIRVHFIYGLLNFDLATYTLL